MTTPSVDPRCVLLQRTQDLLTAAGGGPVTISGTQVRGWVADLGLSLIQATIIYARLIDDGYVVTQRQADRRPYHTSPRAAFAKGIIVGLTAKGLALL
jgi:hypothetical protein